MHRLRRGDKLSKAQRWIGRLLLAHALDLVEPAVVDLPALPPEASDAAHRARDLFALLAGLRPVVTLPREAALPMPFSVRLVQDLCRLRSVDTAHKAINALIAAEVIVKAGEERRRQPHPTPLYVPKLPKQGSRRFASRAGVRAPAQTRSEECH